MTLDRPRQLRAGCSPTRPSTTRCCKTFTIGVLSTVPQLLLALGLAHLLNYRLRGRTFLRVAMLMPYATSRRRGHAGLRAALRPGRRADQRAARRWSGSTRSTGATATGPRRSPSRSIVIWRWTGYNALIYLAGMQSISQDLYEAAAIDGANRWQQFRHVTLPGLRPDDPVHHRRLHDRRHPAVRRAAAVRRRPGRTAAPVNQYQTLGLFMYQQGWQYRAARPGRRGRLGDVPADHRCWCC